VSHSAPAGGGTAPALGPDTSGHFGGYGGRFVPESLISALAELEAQYTAAKADPSFQAELSALLRGYAGRPTLLTPVPRFSAAAGCAVLLKREDLAHTGSHKINTVSPPPQPVRCSAWNAPSTWAKRTPTGRR
jgi:tryptophan synthase beta chain